MKPKSDDLGKPHDQGEPTPGSVTQALTVDQSESAVTKPLDSSADTKPLVSIDTVAPPTTLSTHSPASPASSAATISSKPQRQITVGMVQGSLPAARQVIDDDDLNRVQKFRQISSAVIDEAAYDPSLRFVLVAAALFVMFLLLLLASELIT